MQFWPEAAFIQSSSLPSLACRADIPIVAMEAVRRAQSFPFSSKPAPRLDETEKRIMLMMHEGDGESACEIGKTLHRHRPTVGRVLHQIETKSEQRPVGRPRALTQEQKLLIIKTIDEMVDAAEASFRYLYMFPSIFSILQFLRRVLNV